MSNSETNLVEALRVLLADSYTLQLKTQNYHWNVTGPHFFALHNLFEEQYSELFEANDEIAERIRAIGHKAPGSYTAFADLANVKEDTGEPDAMTMVKNLAKDHEQLAKTASALIKAAEAANDEVSVDIGVQRQTVHEKAGWMLKAHLEG